MSSLMATLNVALGLLAELALWPFRQLPPMIGLVIVSLLTAIVMLLVYRATSDQDGIDRIKRKIHAGLFEIRLFNDDLGAILRAQAEILRSNLTYMRLNLTPMLVMIVPFVLLIAQLQFHYGYSGLAIGESTLLKVQLRETLPLEDSASVRPAITLAAPAAVKVETPMVWLPALRQAVWRLQPQTAGTFELTVRISGRDYGKQLVVSDAIVQRSPDRLEAGFLNQLLYPAEPPLPADGAVSAISLEYPEATVNLLGWQTHWLIAFVILSMVLAYALKGRFGVRL